MNEQASRFVGSIPTNYDEGLGPHIFFGFADDLVQRVAAYAPRKVLELASGTGIVTRRLRNALEIDCTLTASDLNPPMLEVARDKFADGEDIEFRQADATALPFDNESFDLVVCQFGVMFFPDISRSHREVRRVLQAGGRYIFNVWGSWDHNPFARIAHITIAEMFPDNPPGFYKVPFGYNNPEEISEALSGAGFEDMSIEAVDLQSKIISADLFARGLVYGNPLQEEIQERGGDVEEAHRALASALSIELGDTMPLQALVVEARVGSWSG